MASYASALAAVFVACGAAAFAAEPPEHKHEHEELTSATFLITGLHCPPCAKTVESSLRRVDGVHSIKVNYKAKVARLEFDEHVVPAQRVAQLIADTPHMMGGDMRYGGWLALRVPELKDEASAKTIETALGDIEGVQRVKPYVAQHSIGVAFGDQGELSVTQLIDALKAAGFDAESF